MIAWHGRCEAMVILTEADDKLGLARPRTLRVARKTRIPNDLLEQQLRRGPVSKPSRFTRPGNGGADTHAQCRVG